MTTEPAHTRLPHALEQRDTGITVKLPSVRRPNGTAAAQPPVVPLEAVYASLPPPETFHLPPLLPPQQHADMDSNVLYRAEPALWHPVPHPAQSYLPPPPPHSTPPYPSSGPLAPPYMYRQFSEPTHPTQQALPYAHHPHATAAYRNHRGVAYPPPPPAPVQHFAPPYFHPPPPHHQDFRTDDQHQPSQFTFYPPPPASFPPHAGYAPFPPPIPRHWPAPPMPHLLPTPPPPHRGVPLRLGFAPPPAQNAALPIVEPPPAPVLPAQLAAPAPVEHTPSPRDDDSDTASRWRLVTPGSNDDESTYTSSSRTAPSSVSAASSSDGQEEGDPESDDEDDTDQDDATTPPARPTRRRSGRRALRRGSRIRRADDAEGQAP